MAGWPTEQQPTSDKHQKRWQDKRHGCFLVLVLDDGKLVDLLDGVTERYEHQQDGHQHKGSYCLKPVCCN